MPTAIIVDDSAIMRAQIRRVLSAAGFSIAAEAESGEQLMALYEQHQPDLVSLDIVMPGRDGVSAAAELLGKFPRAVVVMCTSLTSRDRILACQKVGVRHYLLKPFNPDHAAQIYKHAVTR